MQLELSNLKICVDERRGVITSLVIRGEERLTAPTPIFTIRLRDEKGDMLMVNSTEAKTCETVESGIEYTDFEPVGLIVSVYLTGENGEANWRIKVKPTTNEYFVEWVDFVPLTLPALRCNNESGTGGEILFPYNEGVLISDISAREESFLHFREPEYPSEGCFGIFPNMICSQMLAYIWNDASLYMGAHDQNRGVKDINFMRVNDGVMLRIRLFCGTDFGEEFAPNYPIVFAVTSNSWHSPAERYRKWFESALPPRVKKITENENAPSWYEDSPLVISYPVRGVHDMDEMKPNKLYPYINALPTLDEIKKATDARQLVLLMHWEGTAPWAPPFVWPPFGGEQIFNEFKEELHDRGDMLGVYCSGFGYTKQSNLIESYNLERQYEEEGIERGACAGPDGKVLISKICEAQRSGYDICPASKVGREVLTRAYRPLLESGIDYAQILDQNHGGGQYFCYSREHGHAPGPGEWMTKNMQDMLSEWNEIGGKMALGCESASAEPFIGNLLFSDNRYELNYMYGTPVPLYAYIYHEYLRNFMGNQVCCPFSIKEDTLRYRLGYSFCIGDCMTLVLTEDGKLSSHWGLRDFSTLPDKEKALKLIKNLTAFYKKTAKPYLFAGRMIETPPFECESVVFSRDDSTRKIVLPAVISSAWRGSDGSEVVILVNPKDEEVACKMNGMDIAVSRAQRGYD